MQTNKTICFFNSTNAWGGGEKWHSDTSNMLNKEGFNVKLVISDKSSWKHILEQNNTPFDTISISNLSFLNPIKILKIAKYFKRTNTHTVIINLPRDLKAAGIAAKYAGVKNIVYRRGSAIPIKNTFLNRYLFKNIVTTILANSEKTKQTINNNNANLFPNNKIFVVYNGMNINEFNKQEVKKIYQSKNNEIVIGNIGRVVEQKAQNKLLDLALILKQSDIKFKIIIGGEGKLLQELKSKSKELDIDNNIIFHGFVKDTKSFLESIDLFILTSKWEGFGYVIVEAMACKKPVIAFNTSSNPEIIDNNTTGYLIKPYNIDEIANKVIDLSKNDKLREQMGIDAYKRAVEKFSIKENLKNLLSLDFINECKN